MHAISKKYISCQKNNILLSVFNWFHVILLIKISILTDKKIVITAYFLKLTFNV